MSRIERSNEKYSRAEGKAQGRRETTLTERFENSDCRCDTYYGNLGPCETFLEGVNGRCVYCDHLLECHHA